MSDSVADAPGYPRRRRLSAVLRSTLLNLAAAGGAVCIVLVVLALVFHITLIMFKTGSMAPEIPAGSLAVVREIPAADARVGQIVTVDRPGELPVTHRVVRVTPAAGTAEPAETAGAAEPGAATLVLKGDANPVNDPAPYTVPTVRLVVWLAPGLARVIVWLSDPFVLGGLTVAVAGLITWALWPGKARPARHAEG
jgi:signal peptidase